MNDDFLYRLRTPPRVSFAARLKARLDFQATLVAAKRRAMRWYVFLGILIGASAIAALKPTVRTSVAAWWQTDSSAVHAVARNSGGDRTPLQSHHGPSAAKAAVAAHESIVDEPTDPAPATSSSGPSSRKRLSVLTVIDTERSRGAFDALVDGFEGTYGYEVARRSASPDNAMCMRFAFDVIVSLGRLGDSTQSSCEPGAARLMEIPVGYEAYVAIVNRDSTWNDAQMWVDALTIEDLRGLEQMPLDTLTTWSQLRASWPSLPIALAGIDSAHGTLNEYFTPQRGDRQNIIRVRKDDSGVVKAVTSTYGALGFMTYATFKSQTEAARKKDGGLSVRVLGILNRQGDVVMPSIETISNGRYDTLSRPLLLYFNVDRLAREGVMLFGTYAVEGAAQHLSAHGMTPLDKQLSDEAARKVRAAVHERQTKF